MSTCDSNVETYETLLVSLLPLGLDRLNLYVVVIWFLLVRSVTVALPLK
ncbi:hypothetical protein [Psychrobacillus sp. FSL K6-1464]